MSGANPTSVQIDGVEQLTNNLEIKASGQEDLLEQLKQTVFRPYTTKSICWYAVCFALVSRLPRRRRCFPR